ncbi:hypothetical protein [Spiroplasma ixodetis]|uniref:hypothetical protein n=1 Tax=Spiroplasma ixodetis TaxID=2141 RepID=UPI002578F917|nr:hypothetical protein [Spiroplasma ixodetis]WJG70657.1 hypothetical protein SIXOD_v1c18620 [Spiroplasma ixodetis Y32]
MKTKKLLLITVSLFILTILLMIIGLMLIGFSKHYDCMPIINLNSKLVLIEKNGFSLLNYISVNYVLSHSTNFIRLTNNYYNWIQLQIGVIFCVILVPILGLITLSLTFLIIGLKIKVKNNNFWDAIQNCEIISNYYIN